MTSKTILAAFVAIAFVAVIMTMTTVDAAKGDGPNGQPFQQLEEQIEGIDQRVTDVEQVTAPTNLLLDEITQILELFGVDSFFDVFVDLRETDADLQSQIDKVRPPTDIEELLDKEVAARMDADDALQKSIDTETESRIQADADLQLQIDQVRPPTRIEELLDKEVTARIEADDALHKRIDQIPPETFSVDSFFDVFYRIPFNPDNCEPGTLPKANPDNNLRTDCVPESEFVVDSFFDVFFDIETQVDQNTDDVDTIQTEILSMSLSGGSPLTVQNIGSSGEDGVQILLPKGSLQSQIDALEARIAALESGETPPRGEPTDCDPNGNGTIEPVELASHANITIEDALNLISEIENLTHDSNNNGVIDTQTELTVLIIYGSQFAGVDFESCTISGVVPLSCDTDSDGAITDQEMLAYFTALEGTSGPTLEDVQQLIFLIEDGAVDSNNNGVIDTPGEIQQLNFQAGGLNICNI